jgi:copper chaperone
MTTAFTVENIKCGGCANSITNRINKIKGVNKVDVNVEDQVITVDGTFDESEITSTLAGMGYPRVGENDILKKAKSFVSCAIGRMQD